MKRRSSTNSDEENEISSNRLPIYFNRVNQLGARYNQKKDTISLNEILNDPKKRLQSSFHFNFLFDVDWLISMYPEKYRNSNITIVYGKGREPLIRNPLPPSINLIEVKINIPYGSHHSKMIILFYQDCCQLVFHTANMTSSDWKSLTQIMWKSPYFYKKRSDSSEVDDFKSDLIMYFKSYNLPQMDLLADTLREYDMTSAKVKLIASVPGCHTNNDLYKYGHLKMREVLRNSRPLPEDSSIVGQFSSIGTFRSMDPWLIKEWGKSMTGTIYDLKKKDLYLIFPTEKNIIESFDGVDSGEAFPYMSEVHHRQEHIERYLCKWKSEENGRTRAVPHSKCYFSLSANQTMVNWFLLTSANLSKSAWGQFQRSESQFLIRSYECGVLFLPEKYNAQYFRIERNTDEIIDNYEFPACLIPPDIPLSKYSDDDEPWLYDKE